MTAALAAVTAFSTLFVVAGAAVPAAAAAGNGCPANKTLGSVKTASNVAADFSNSGFTTTYKFYSLTNQNPVGGVPGLVRYCVYPTPTSQPTAISVLATGANGAKWSSSKGSNNFAFLRPGGDKTNIPLDGNTTTMGTATWGTVPTSQDIVLHINDPGTCASLYGSGTSFTCFVKPRPGPICNAGDDTVAYNAMPFGVVNCINPALGFEAQQVNEFGDEVGLAGTARNFASLKVLFASFACQSGHWHTGDCVSAPGATFTHDITANIYDPSDLTTTIASVTTNQTIPYRPSADPNCPQIPGGGVAQAAWFNPQAPGGGACQNSIGKVLTFNFSGETLPDTVVWTVAFNTTHYGYSPMGEAQSCFGGAGGCPYDSLNVGAKTYSGAPYAGTDVVADEAFISDTPNPLLHVDSGWSNNRPLGEIITAP
jgi:hypothetical protein